MDAQSVHLGLLRIDDYSFAVCSNAIQRVIARPALGALPDAGSLATGAFQFEGVTVPVFDVASLLSGVSAPVKPRSLIAILRHKDEMLCLEIDGFRKVIRWDESACTNTVQSSQPEAEGRLLFPRSFWDLELGSPVGVMDTGALFRAAGVRSVRAHRGQAASQTSGDTVNLALFQVHGRTFGVDIRYVREALHPGKITQSQFGGLALYGHHMTEARQTPIIRISEYLQLPSQGGEAEPQRGLVIGSVQGDSIESKDPQNDLTVGFLIENVAGTTTLPVSQIHALERSGMRRTECYRGVVITRDGGHILVLNPETLLRVLGVRKSGKSALGHLSSPLLAGAKSVEATATLQPFVVYRAGDVSLASPLNDVEAVVPLKTFFPLGQPGDAFAGVMPWRDLPVNLLNVSALIGEAHANIAAFRNVLIIGYKSDKEKKYYGFLVNDVESLASAVLERSPMLNRPRITAMPKERSDEIFGNMIRVQAGESRRNITVMNFRHLSRWMAEEARPFGNESPAVQA